MTSNYFTPKEMFGSDELPSWEAIDNIQTLITMVLNPLRIAYGKPIKVNSCYRTPERNKTVGGAPNSQHVQGEAVDLDTGSRDGNIKLFNIIKDKLHYDQLIDERNYSWIHVSYTTARPNRNQILHL